MKHEVLRAIITDYSAFLQAEKGMAESSRRSYLTAATGFLKLCRAQPEALFLPEAWELSHLDKRAVEIYLNQLRDRRGWKAASLAQQASALRTFFSYLQTRGHLERNPARRLHPRVPARPFVPPEGEEAAVLALFQREPASLAEARLLVLLELFYGGGLRASQVYRIQSTTVRRRQGVVRLQLPGETLELPCSREGLARINAYLAQRRSVLAGQPKAPFWVDARGRTCTPARLSREVRRALASQGLDGGPTLLRQLAARHFRERGGDTRSLRRLLGVKRLGTLDRYAPPDYQQVLREFRRVHPRQAPEG